MWRVLNVVDEMAHSLTRASSLLKDALEAIDHEMSILQGRLHEDAEHLHTAITEADLSPEDKTSLLVSLRRMEATAESVADFARRPRIAVDDNTEPQPSVQRPIA